MHASKYARQCLAGILLTALAGAGSAHAQTPANADPLRTTLRTVVVTGTRAFNRTVADSLAPIDVLTPADLAATGAPDLDTALRQLLPAFNFPQPSVTGQTDATQPAQLRGLSPDETLVLINGKRQHTTAIVNDDGPMIGRGSSPVDLAAIPMDAIERIEVLRDGAAAQYGSDAIAGVINIILKGGADHGGVHVSRGVHGQMQGHTWNGGADGGVRLGQRGWVHFAGDYEDQGETNHAGQDLRFPADPTYATRVVHFGLPALRAAQAALNAQYDLGAHAQLYAFGVYNHRDVHASGTFHSLTQYTTCPPVAPNTCSPAALAVYPDGMLPIKHIGIRDDFTVLGLRGEAAGWHYDFSGSTGGSHSRQFMSSSFNYSLGAASPTAFYDGTLAIRQDIVNADFSRDFQSPWANPLTVAWGLAWRHGAFSIKPGDATALAGTGGVESSGFSLASAGTHTRTNAAEYIDLETDFTDRLAASLAARHEHYSDFGNTTSWKLSARYAFTPVIALRGTASTGFRAPALQQEYDAKTALEFQSDAEGNTRPYQVSTFPATSAVAAALGARPLQPEKSRNFSIGLVLTPRVGPYVTLDAYQIDVNDRIILSGDLVGDAVENYLDSLGILAVGGARFFTNAVDTRTRGADLIATWPIALAAARLKFTAGINYNQTRIRAIQPNPAQLGLAGLVLPVIDRAEQGRITVGTPRTKAFIATEWSRAHWRLHAQLTRYGEWEVLGPAPIADQTYGARVLLDASASYALAHWNFTLGGNNLTNTYPAKNDAANNFAGNITYPFSSPFGFSGAYWYASVGYRW